MKDVVYSFFLTKWRVVIYALIVVVLALAVTIFSQNLGLRFFDFIAGNQDKKLSAYLETENKYVSESVSKFAKKEELRSSIKNSDSTSLSASLSQEKKLSGLMAYTVSDVNGIALSRIPVKSNLGDNIFLTLPTGRALSAGNTDAVYGRGRNFSLTTSAGNFVKDEEGTIIGAVFGGYWFDNNYAQNFKSKYLNNKFLNQEVIFYSKEEGVTGSSVKDENIKSKLLAYIDHASALIQDGRSGDLIALNDTDYVITNHLLAGEDDVYGGILLLTPLPFNLFLRSMFVALLLAFIFFLSLLIIEKVTVPELIRFKKKHLYTFLILISAGVFIFIWFGMYFDGKSYLINLNKQDLTIYNSTMKIRPGSGVYTVGYPQQVALVVYSGGEEIDAVEAHLKFDPSMLRVDSLSFDRSICTKDTIVQKEIDNQNGEISVTCTITDGAFSDIRGTVADISFTPITTGNAYLGFSEETQVLASDGLGTDVLRSVTSGYYRIFNEKDMGNFFSKNAVAIPFSPTHENSSVWYSNKHVVIMWPKMKSTDYVYELSQDSTSTIANPKFTSSTKLTFDVPEDGVYYFKLAPKQDDETGDVSVFKIKIDTTPPDLPLIKSSSLQVKKNNIVRFELSSNDDLSGLQKNFYVRLDGGTWIPTSGKIYMPFNETGNHKIGVRVFDNAENYSDAEVNVSVIK